MKKRIAIICCVLMLAVALLSVFTACKNDKFDDETLVRLRSNLYNQYKEDPSEQNKSYSLLGEITDFDSKGKEISCAISWTIEGTDKVTVSSKTDKDGNYTVNVPDPATLTEDIAYTLKGTLVNSKGKAYTGYKGDAKATYTVTFNRTVKHKASTDPDAVLLFNSSEKATSEGSYTDTYGNVGFEKVTWVDNGITLVTSRSDSTSGCVINTPTARFYSKSIMEISYTSPIKAIRITFDTYNNGQYTTGFDGMTVDGATFNHEIGSDTLIISFATPVEKFTSAPLKGQTRITKVEVFTSYVPVIVKYETEAEILEGLKNLPTGETLPGGPYTLTGTVVSIGNASTSNANNVIVNIEVGSENYPIQCYYLTNGANVAVGDVITVTGSLKNFSGTIEFDSGCTYVRVGDPVYKLQAITTPVAGTYKLGVYQANISGGKWLYLNGSMDGYYFATTDDRTQAASIVLAETAGGWTLKVENTGKYVTMVARDGSTTQNPSSSLAFGSAECVWQWDSELHAFYITIDGTDFYLGTYGTRTNLQGSKKSYFTQANPNFLAYLGTIVEDTAA